ncbi:hypothetical protein [Paraburkholderia rhizosphaerae]|uniref:Uncharacterized protein n=1 Tax=Paraburkholderia rhizosphaerae TaxID=480658 RepID=A0A4R8M3P8_9BURK|nr:hypothetical protein [Paraburkholderia rhizosphaerae]TDY54733.1 hypothetical protein BX592_101189 [Paraburkholderia rhizosphaerae]
MKDAFERRALLLHLGAVLDAMDKLLAYSGDRSVTVLELVSEHRALASLPLLPLAPAEMTVHGFTQRVSAAFAVWPAELLEAELNRQRLAAVVRDALFVADIDGWHAYVDTLKQDVHWFGDGLPPLPTEAAITSKAAHRAGQSRGKQAEAASSESDPGGFYPSWPWKP